MDEKRPICPTCAAWQSYPCIIGRTKTEAMRCMKGVQGAPERTECPYYLREPGADDEVGT